MLDLINAERRNAGVDPVVLGDNVAAQIHAEASLDGCFASHWGLDGLKPYMRYSLAGGYQSNGENASGFDYCSVSDGPIGVVDEGIAAVMEGWMSSPGHRRNILDKTHKKVNTGLAWDRYNFNAIQHFEGDYFEYDRLPAIDENGVLSFEGRVKNGVILHGEDYYDLGVGVFYDPPPHALTRGQLSRTYCYDGGLPVAALRPPSYGGYSEHTFTTTREPCPDPYDVPADAPAPRSLEQSRVFFELARSASERLPEQSITVPWITVPVWTAWGYAFAVAVSISDVLAQYGSGVYSITVFGIIDGDDVVISEYSIFHGAVPPDTYSSER